MAHAPLLTTMNLRIFLDFSESQFHQLGFICKMRLLKFLSHEVLVKRDPIISNIESINYLVSSSGFHLEKK